MNAGDSLSLGHLTDRLSQFGPPVTVPTPMPQTGPPRQSAVLAPLYEDAEGVPMVVLTRRAQHLRNHRGEVSFPGGRREAGDADLVETALRETEEEIALDRAAVRVVGQLDGLTTFSSQSEIHAHVGVIDGGRPDLRPEEGEVEAILHVSLRELLEPGVYREEAWRFGDGAPRPMHFFEVVGDTIWGATARILRQLLLIGLELDPRR